MRVAIPPPTRKEGLEGEKFGPKKTSKNLSRLSKKPPLPGMFFPLLSSLSQEKSGKPPRGGGPGVEIGPMRLDS